MAGSGSALVAHESESDSDGLPSFDDDSQSSSAEDDEDEHGRKSSVGFVLPQVDRHL